MIFTPPHPLNTAVLFIIFNRLDTAKEVFQAIRQAKPSRFYIAADGPRKTKIDEDLKVKAVREFILSNIDWECELKTLFREDNLGCKYSVSGAIDWFFENEEQGVILEDDCVPTQSFFWYCEKMLNDYQDDNRIMMITGTNYLLDIREEVKNEYFFSRHFSIWGWATWKRAWSTYDVELDSYHQLLLEEKDYSYLSLSKHEESFYNSLIQLILAKNVDTWDYQWVFNCIYNYGLCITPSVNLISNLGVEGAHAIGKTENNFMPTLELNLAQIHNRRWVIPNMFHDKKVSERNFKVQKYNFFKSKFRRLIELIFK